MKAMRTRQEAMPPACALLEAPALAAMTRALWRERRWWTWRRRAERLAFLGVVGVTVAYLAVGGAGEDIAGLLFSLLVLGVFLVLALSPGEGYPPVRWRRAAEGIRDLVRTARDPRLCAALLEAAAALDAAPGWGRDARAVVRAALAKLLPRMESEDAAALGETQRIYLRHVLARASSWSAAPYRSDFLVAVLLALGTLGESEAAADARWLSGWHWDERVRTAAAECLRDLRLRRSEER